eukprot:TRINITY_DN10393_c0_g1_i1.p1 TRINITY_DN10393_c0_g1~~TRINITY_DN10393_c0_g1_i1.p1  ORF type:complete len:1142 (-),score=278.39 TRINITY_DN10393_c0_g1_i1:110-3535(-)
MSRPGSDTSEEDSTTISHDDNTNHKTPPSSPPPCIVVTPEQAEQDTTHLNEHNTTEEETDGDGGHLSHPQTPQDPEKDHQSEHHHPTRTHENDNQNESPDGVPHQEGPPKVAGSIELDPNIPHYEIRYWMAKMLPERKEIVDPSLPLATILKDGILLCHLMNVVCPKMMKIGNFSYISEVIAREYIGKYLTCCSSLGIPAEKQFDSSDLYEQKNIDIVIKNLQALKDIQELGPTEIEKIRAQFKENIANMRSVKSIPVLPSPTSSGSSRASKVGTYVPPPSKNTTPQRRLSILTEAEAFAIKQELQYDPELERAIKDWIADLLNVNLGTEKLHKLILSGTLLCRVLETVKEGSISTQYLKESKLAYVQRATIGHFLDVCHDVLGIPKLGFFEVSDLYDGKNLVQVMNSLFVVIKTIEKLPHYQGPKIKDPKSRTLFIQSIVESEGDETVVKEEQLSRDEQELLNWANNVLTTHKHQPLLNLTTDFRSCVKLIQVVEALTKQGLMGSYLRSASTIAEYMRNATILLRELESFYSFDCTGQDIVRGNKVAIVGLLAKLREKFDYDYVFQKLLHSDKEKTKNTTEEILIPGEDIDESFWKTLNISATALQSLKNQYANLKSGRTRNTKQLGKALSFQTGVNSRIRNSTSDYSDKRASSTRWEMVLDKTKNTEREENKLKRLSLGNRASTVISPQKSDEPQKKTSPTSPRQAPPSPENKKRKGKETKKDLKRSTEVPKRKKDKFVGDTKRSYTKLFSRKKDKGENQDFNDVQVVFVARPTEPKKVEEGAKQESDSNEFIENVIIERTLDGLRIRINRIQTEEDKLIAAQHKMREHVFRELVNTEKSYFDNLSNLERGLSVPSAKILSAEELKFAFSNLTDIVSAHSIFFEVLKNALQCWNFETSVGQIFLHHGNFIKQYEPYLKNYVTSLVYVFAYKKKNPEFANLISKFEESQSETTMLKTPSFLIMPVQRIPRYILLLRDMSRYTSESTKDQTLLGEAIKFLDENMVKINANIDPSLYPRMKKVLDALESIDGFQGDLLNLNRDLLKEGPLHLKKSKKKTRIQVKKKQSYSFLFNDILIYCFITEPQKYQEIATIDLKAITSVVPEGQSNIVLNEPQNQWVFTIPPEDRDTWLTHIQKSLTKN